MKLKPIKIGTVETKNNLFLAPLAGYTDFAFRGICSDFGAGLTFTEMVSCKGLLYDNERTIDLLRTSEKERIKAAQIFGNDPSIMRRACESEALAPFDIVDINMGCPVPKLNKNGEGSALLSDIKLAEKVVSECVKSGKNITVKMRIGIEEGKPVTEDYAKMIEQAGGKMISVHGRYKQAFYSGEANFEEIAKAKAAVNIPVIANGGIFSEADADKMLERTGADGVMLARAALYKPWLFLEMTAKTSFNDVFSIIKEQVEMLSKYENDHFVAVNMRKQIVCYLKGVSGGKKAKVELLSAETCDELLKLCEKYFKD